MREQNLILAESTRVQVPDPSGLACQIPLFPPLGTGRWLICRVDEGLYFLFVADVDEIAGRIPGEWVAESLGKYVRGHGAGSFPPQLKGSTFVLFVEPGDSNAVSTAERTHRLILASLDDAYSD